ncbi:MAG: FAD:protein FMN transferase [Bacillota bacterium]|nr:FAD:protein FMN transferase [Bacillota bacterium]
MSGKRPVQLTMPGRRIAAAALLVLLALLLLLSTACQTPGATPGAPPATAPAGTAETELTRYSRQFLGVFDTVTTFIGLAGSEEDFAKIAAAVEQKLTHCHQLFTTYESYEGITNLRTVNERAGEGPVTVDPLILDLLEQSLAANALSGGRVNLALGPVLELWHDYREAGLDDPENAQLPPMDQLEAANRHTDISLIEIDRRRSTVRLPDPEMCLDVGSGAKGLACELAAGEALRLGMEHFLLSVGGNVRTAGFRDGREKVWRIGIREPQSQDPNAYRLVVGISDMAVVTSGAYERFYTVAGRRYHHIIDPDTLMPSQRFDSVTIIAPDSGLADSLTTALFNMDQEAGLRLIENLENVGAIWMAGEKVWYSSRIDAWLVD